MRLKKHLAFYTSFSLTQADLTPSVSWNVEKVISARSQKIPGELQCLAEPCGVPHCLLCTTVRAAVLGSLPARRRTAGFQLTLPPAKSKIPAQKIWGASFLPQISSCQSGAFLQSPQRTKHNVEPLSPCSYASLDERA